MDFVDIRAMATLSGEGTTVEFKKSTGQLERGMETLCAFLNGEGGTVLFGVTDKGEIVGQQVSDTTKQNIVEAFRRFEPSVKPDVSYVSLPNSDKQVVAVSVKGDRQRRPFFYKNSAYLRVQSTTIPMPQDRLLDMVMMRGGKEYVWESMPAEDVTLEDIDRKLVVGAVDLGIHHNRIPESVATQSVEDMLKGFGLYTSTGRLNNAVMVLFGKNMQSYPQCLLRMAKFNGSSHLDDFIDNQRVEGNIYVLIDAAMSFFAKHLNISGRINPATWQREDELPIPRKALRESIVNACAHRLYHRRGSSVSVAIYTDRIEIVNTGTFPSGITAENLTQIGKSEPMNPLIANVLFKTSYLEHWGRGIKMMVDECVSRGLKAPTFTTDGYTVCATFFLPDGYDAMFDNQHIERLGDDTKSDNQRVVSKKDVTKSVNKGVEAGKGDTKLRKNVTKSAKGETKSKKDVTKSVNKGGEAGKGDTKLRKNVTKSAKGETKSKKDVTKSVNKGVEAGKGDTKLRKNVTKSAKGETKSKKDVTKSVNKDVETGKNDAKSDGNRESEVRRNKLIDLMKGNPLITYDELQNIFGVSRMTISRDVIILTKAHRIKRTGGTFGGKWVVIG